MIRWIAVLSTLLALGGCVTTREVVYRDGYSYSRDGSYVERRYYDADGNYYVEDDRRTIYRDGSYYRPAYAGSGDYYVGSSHGWNGYVSYWDYPAYYSVFWPMYRSWYDPYWYPNYYYGVTYFPRSYLSFGFGSGWRPYYSSWYYSPYRYSWVDNYYDWTPWYGLHWSHRDSHYRPRYGSSHNQAERIARLGGGRYNPVRRNAGYDGYEGGRPGVGPGNSAGRVTAIDRYGRTRGTNREADYRSRPDPRQTPASGAFGIPTRAGDGDVRRVGGRADRDFSVPLDDAARRNVRGNADYGPLPERPPAATTRRYDGGEAYPRTYSREARSADVPTRSYDAGSAAPGYERRAATPDYSRSAAAREYSRQPQPAFEPRRQETPVTRGSDTFRARAYDGGGGAQSMPPRDTGYETRSAPRYEAPPPVRSESRSESRSEPRYESRQESSRSESRSESRGGPVRRVGSRDDRR